MNESTSDQEFHNFTASEELKFVKHNPTDFDSFKKFQNELNERFSKIEDQKERREILANLKRWEEMLPSRWSEALLTKITPPADIAAEEIIKILERQSKPSLYIKGASGSGKTYLAYGTLRRFIGKNWVSPSQIKIISEETLLGIAASGFEGQSRFNELLKTKYTTYLFDGVASKGSYSPREQQLWEQLIDHIYSKSLTVIFTSNKPADTFASCLSDSAESKLSHLVNGKIINVRGRVTAPSLDRESKSGKSLNEKEIYESDLFEG